MNKLQGFLASRQAQLEPPTEQYRHARPDRQDAIALKFSSSKPSMKSTIIPNVASRTIASDYDNGDYNTRPTLSHAHQSPRDEYDQPHNSFFDDTIHSNFEDTLTNASYSRSQEISEGVEDENHDMEAESDHAVPVNSHRSGAPSHTLNHKPSHAQLVLTVKDPLTLALARTQTSAMNNRFAASQGGYPVRPAKVSMAPSEQDLDSGKRPRSIDHFANTNGFDISPQHNRTDVRSEDEYQEESQPPSPTPTHRRPVRHHQSSRDYNQPSSQTIAQGWTSAKVVDISTDHTTEELQNMKYSALASQRWEDHPGRQEFILHRSLLAPTTTFSDKINHYVLHEASVKRTTQSQEDDECPGFFASLSIEEWDEAGDWFIDKFTTSMKQLREKRVEKRALAMKFEREIERRESMLRGESDRLDRELAGMKAGGENLLKGKLG